MKSISFLGAIGTIAIFVLLPARVLARLGHRSEHISIEFFITGEKADQAKDTLLELLEKIPDDQQLNLTCKLDRLHSHLELSSNASSSFASLAENFLNVAKNESERLLQKLRQVPPGAENITDAIKSHLTDYFSEMENFHVILCAILDDTIEFTLDSVQMLQSTFMQFTDVQNDITEQRKAQVDEWCRNRYNDFLWQSADEVFQCATGKMRVTYDIYSITKMTTYHVMKMLEHRIQKLYNCFQFGKFALRCRFVRNAEADFEKLHTRLDDLQMYNEKQKRKIYRNQLLGGGGGYIKCIPENFPDGQMSDSLKSCLYFAQHGIE